MIGSLDETGKPDGPWHYGQDFVDEAESKMTKEAIVIRDWLLKQYKGEYDSINAVFRKVNGINLPSNDNYSPLTVTPMKVAAGQEMDPVTGAVYAAGSRIPGALRSRGAAIAEPDFRDAVQTYLAHTIQMEHWKAYAEFNQEVNALLMDRNVNNVATSKAGQEAASVLRAWVKYFNEGGSRDAASHLAITKGISGMLGRASTMALFGRIGTIAIQSTQLGAAASKMPAGAYVSRLGRLLSGNLSWGESLKSEYIQRRIAQLPPSVQVAMEGLKSDNPNIIRETARNLGKLIAGADGLFTAGTYAMVYDYQLTQLIDSGVSESEAQQIAREEAERITDEIAQPTRAGARSIYELNSTHPAAKITWAFASEARKNLGLLLFAASQKSLPEIARAAVYVVVLNGLLAAVIRGAWKDIRDDDEDDFTLGEGEWKPEVVIAKVLTEPLYGIPVVGGFAQDAALEWLGIYQPNSSLIDKSAGIVRPVKRIPDLLAGELTAREAIRDLNMMLGALGLFNGTVAGAAAISNLGRDIFEAGESNINQD
jgi:hypothetical protein